MLEQNITQLDIDFMILCSKYVIEDKVDCDVLFKLIDLGQLNAIQFFYLIRHPKDSYELFQKKRPCVDKKIKEIKYKIPCINYQEMFALASYYFDIQRDETDEMAIEFLHTKQPRKDMIMDLYNKYKENNDGYKWLLKAKEEIRKENNITLNPLIESMTYEIILSSRIYDKIFNLYSRDYSWVREMIKEEIGQAIENKNRLLKEFKIDPTNDVLAFTLARSIIRLNVFKKVSKVSNSEFKLAINILKNISKKEYSNLINTKNK